MRKKILLCVMLCMTAGTAGFARETDFTRARELAAQRNMRIFAYFSISDNSERCARFERRILRRPEFQKFLAPNFIFFQADFPLRNSPAYKAMPEETREQNRKMASHYRVKAYPTVLILSNKGELIARVVYDDRSTAAQFIETLQKAVYEQSKK